MPKIVNRQTPSQTKEIEVFHQVRSKFDEKRAESALKYRVTEEHKEVNVPAGKDFSLSESLIKDINMI
jgi:hypothetical protein